MGLMGAGMLMASAPVMATSTKVLKCFSPEEMEKPHKERISKVGFARLRDGKKLDYAVIIKKDIESKSGVLDNGVYQLAQTEDDKTSYSADVSINEELRTDLIVKTQAQHNHRLEKLSITIAENNGNSILTRDYSCSSDSKFSRFARRFTKSYEEIRNVELNDIETILMNASNVLDTYNSIMAEAELKKRQYIDLKEKKPFSKVKTDVMSYDEDGYALTEDETLVACMAIESRTIRSKGGGVIDRVECLRPNLTIKKRKKVRKRKKYRFRRGPKLVRSRGSKG